LASRIFSLFLVASLTCWEFAATEARAQGLPLIRDSEIEDTIRSWADPLFTASHLEPGAIRILIVNDESLNAFVAGGQNLFINTGLLIAADTPGQVIGVLAHETGHISGGHLARTADAMREAQTTGLFATLLGIGLVVVGAATGANTGGAGGAMIASGQTTAMRTFLAYSRAQERSADQSAVTLLDRQHISTRGMLAFLDKLADQELLHISRQDAYVRSHPLTRDRIEFIAEHVRQSPWSDETDAPGDVVRQERMRAKLIAFIKRPRQVLKTFYPETDTSLPGRYARAIAYFRQPDLPRALAEVDSLLAEMPQDPYFHELKGQMLYENGHAAEAIPAYAAAVALRPEDPLLLTGLAQVQLEGGGDAGLAEAIASLESARRIDSENPGTWRLLSIGYHRHGDAGAASLAAGEYSLLIGQAEDARLHAGRAEREYAEGSPGWLRAQDIRQEAVQLIALQQR
jgi:predicted Zn-dependent protease